MISPTLKYPVVAGMYTENTEVAAATKAVKTAVLATSLVLSKGASMAPHPGTYKLQPIYRE